MLKRKNEVLRNLKLVHTEKGGRAYDTWQAYLGTDAAARPVRITRSTREELLAAVNEYFANAKGVAPAAGGILNPEQAYDARAAISILNDAHIKATLVEAVREYVAAHTRRASTVALGDAYAEYLASFRAEQEAHLHSIRSYVGKWVVAFGPRRKLADVTAPEVAKYVGKFTADKTHNNALGLIKSFLNWCCKSERGYLDKNPVADMEMRKLAYKEPEYARVEDVARVFAELEKAGDRDAIAYGALAYFCGIRFEEICRLSKRAEQDIRIAEDTIRIAKPKGWLQGMTPRVIHIPANAKEWLLVGNHGQTLGLHNVEIIRKRFRDTAVGLGIDLPENAGRHSFITYHIAAFAQPETTAGLAGNSVHMIVNHYMGLATKSQGEAYFAIRPSRP